MSNIYTIFSALCVWFAECSSGSILGLDNWGSGALLWFSDPRRDYEAVVVCRNKFQGVQKRCFPNPQWDAGGCGSGAPGDLEHLTNILNSRIPCWIERIGTRCTRLLFSMGLREVGLVQGSNLRRSRTCDGCLCWCFRYRLCLTLATSFWFVYLSKPLFQFGFGGHSVPLMKYNCKVHYSVDLEFEGSTAWILLMRVSESSRLGEWS